VRVSLSSLPFPLFSLICRHSRLNSSDQPSSSNEFPFLHIMQTFYCSAARCLSVCTPCMHESQWVKIYCEKYECSFAFDSCVFCPFVKCVPRLISLHIRNVAHCAKLYTHVVPVVFDCMTFVGRLLPAFIRRHSFDFKGGGVSLLLSYRHGIRRQSFACMHYRLCLTLTDSLLLLLPKAGESEKPFDAAEGGGAFLLAGLNRCRIAS
jgi:hypothetical protein